MKPQKWVTESDLGSLGYVWVECECGATWEEFAGAGTHEPDIDNYEPGACPQCEDE